ncbi:hypothetical protein KIL84_007717 [Mauremys mutica]|uniref:Uncharacterized protein n=1 Tax=Mauremys mutica TaxID=74926 RepID=A0A9D3X1I9_9SAUR|nr:hypothetical protein KIL84_007717 [Mauremys mutica]
MALQWPAAHTVPPGASGLPPTQARLPHTGSSIQLGRTSFPRRLTRACPGWGQGPPCLYLPPDDRLGTGPPPCLYPPPDDRLGTGPPMSVPPHDRLGTGIPMSVPTPR